MGDLLVSGRESNFEGGRVMNYVYFSATLDAAVRGRRACRRRRPRVTCIVEPVGEFEDDPNVTDKKFPGIRRGPSEAASRCAWSASLSSGSVTPSRRSRQCEPHSMHCSGTTLRTSRIETPAGRLSGFK